MAHDLITILLLVHINTAPPSVYSSQSEQHNVATPKGRGCKLCGVAKDMHCYHCMNHPRSPHLTIDLPRRSCSTSNSKSPPPWTRMC